VGENLLIVIRKIVKIPKIFMVLGLIWKHFVLQSCTYLLIITITE